MKKIAAVLSTIVALAGSSSALAFRDQSQSVLIARAMEAKKAQQLASTKDKQAGPTGMPARVAPDAKKKLHRRDPTAHP